MNDCERCGERLDYQNSTDPEENKLCSSCESIVRFDLKSDEEKRELL